jgi:hypothetical protein
MRALASLFGMLMLVALIIRLIWWILGAVVLYVLFPGLSIAAEIGAGSPRSRSAARRSSRCAGRPAASLDLER